MRQDENKIEQTLNMANHIQPVEPSSELLQRLKSIPSTIKNGYNLIPKRVVWMAAASIALLISLNLVSIRNYNPTTTTAETETTSDAYFSYLKQI